MLEDSFRRWNPWWSSTEIFDTLCGFTRENLQDIEKILSLPHIKDIIGVRRSGKTTTMYQLIRLFFEQKVPLENIIFLNFDDPNLHESSFDEIEQVLVKINPHSTHLFCDEVQQKKGWERWIRTLYDTKKFKQIIISGSSSSLLTQDIGRVLTGRHITSTVFPYSFKEYLITQGWKDFSDPTLLAQKNTILHYFHQYIREGGFPEVIATDTFQRKSVLTHIYTDILARDICARFTASYDIIQKISYHVLSNIGSEFSFRSIARAADISVETAEKYISYLSESFLFFALPCFSYKTKIQFKQHRKSYCVDTGLRNAVSFTKSPDWGHLIENIVYIELIRRGADVYYWKDTKGEVDFLVKKGLHPTELYQVCWDPSQATKREETSLKTAAQLFKLPKGVILTKDTKESISTDGVTIEYVPVWKWLLQQE